MTGMARARGTIEQLDKPSSKKWKNTFFSCISFCNSRNNLALCFKNSPGSFFVRGTGGLEEVEEELSPVADHVSKSNVKGIEMGTI